MTEPRLITFYLPQFHPIPENDSWWGKGFTEWTNVTRARPLFHGHEQPRLPADLGFYDLRIPETRLAQAELARTHGIEGFCYWHYWYAGKRLLQRPFIEVLRTGEPDFPFCLGWANHSWTGAWHGAPSRILIEQTYPGKEDEKAHFNELLEAFIDSRYIHVDGKPLLIVANPHRLPEPRRLTDHWRSLAIQAGLKGLYLVGISWQNWNPYENGFDASIVFNPLVGFDALNRRIHPVLRFAFRAHRAFLRRVKIARLPVERYPYAAFIANALPSLSKEYLQYPCIIPNWDNTPRAGFGGIVLTGSTPELFQTHLHEAIQQVSQNQPDHQLVFIKSWNEWAEGNYLEPDQKWGRAYLQAICTALGLNS